MTVSKWPITLAITSISFISVRTVYREVKRDWPGFLLQARVNLLIMFVSLSLSPAGQERFKTITSSYYRGAHGVMIVYDIANKETFSNLNKWLNEVETYANEGVLMILVGNKTDLNSQRQVSTECGAEWAALNDMPFIETSAKNSTNVTEAFTMLAELVNKHVKDNHAEQRVFVLGDSVERGLRTGEAVEKEKCGCSN